MGCNLSAQNDDDEESSSRTVPASATPPRTSLHKPRVHDVNRRSGTLHDGSQMPPKDKDRFPVSPQQGKGPALLSRFGDTEESFGSPSFRCYVNSGMLADGKDVVSAICEQKKANRRSKSSPLRNETASPLHPLQEDESLKPHKKERAWISKVLSLRGGA